MAYIVTKKDGREVVFGDRRTAELAAEQWGGRLRPVAGHYAEGEYPSLAVAMQAHGATGHAKGEKPHQRVLTRELGDFVAARVVDKVHKSLFTDASECWSVGGNLR